MGEGSAGTLAMILAQEAIFGKTVMKQCTVMGSKDFHGLPTTELMQLKEINFSKFPQLWDSPMNFEAIWKRCHEAIGQACKRLRKL